MDKFRSHYREISGRHATCYPGVIEGLNAMRAMGLPLACVTNKASEFTLPLLERSGLVDYFTQIVCGDTFTSRSLRGYGVGFNWSISAQVSALRRRRR